MMPKCAICLSSCTIPVEMTCFGCYYYDCHKPSCMTFHRVCEPCAIRYLELDRAPEQRSESKRCLFCESTCNPRNMISSYRIDFVLLRLDTNPDVRCPNQECSVTGSHSMIEEHYHHECPWTITFCLCNTYGTRDLIASRTHRESCIFYEKCSVCSAYVLINKMVHHYEQTHEMKVCTDCSKPTKLSMKEHLFHECNERLLICPFCQKYLQIKEAYKHYISHAEECQHRMGILKQVYEKENNLLHAILEYLMNLR